MTDDIVTRLREYDFMRDGDTPDLTMAEAADEIERLRDELRRVIPFGDSAGVISELMADRDRWVEIAQLWNGAYSAQTYIHGLDEIETADMARKAQAMVVRDER